MSGARFSPKIALLGSGQIGGTVALLSALRKLSNNLVFLDVVPDMPSGKALDVQQAMAAIGCNCSVTGSSDISETSEGLKGADVVVVTAGFPRKPGMSRDDLLAKNAEVISGVGRAIKAQCPGAFVICITNPLDVMVSVLQRASGLPHNRVVGMAGMLDSARLKTFLAEEMKCSPKDVSTLVMGGHGDSMVPLQSATSISGIPLQSCIEMGLISESRVGEIFKRTRNGGGEIVALLKMGSAFVAPAVCAADMIESYLRDERRVLPCCAMMTGEYGVNGCYGGVPVIIGKNGVEKVLEVPLSVDEMSMFEKSMAAVQDLRGACKSLGFDA